MELALASIIAGDGAATAGLPTPEDVAYDSNVCQIPAYIGHEVLRQAHLPIREGDLELTSSNSIKGAPYIGGTPWSWNVSSLPPPGGTFHPFSDGCLSDPWRLRFLKR